MNKNYNKAMRVIKALADYFRNDNREDGLKDIKYWLKNEKDYNFVLKIIDFIEEEEYKI